MARLAASTREEQHALRVQLAEQQAEEKPQSAAKGGALARLTGELPLGSAPSAELEVRAGKIAGKLAAADAAPPAPAPAGRGAGAFLGVACDGAVFGLLGQPESTSWAGRPQPPAAAAAAHERRADTRRTDVAAFAAGLVKDLGEAPAARRRRPPIWRGGARRRCGSPPPT